MDKVSVALRVFFEDPFWIGILERVSEGRMTVSKITFGPEPRDYEVQEFLMKNYYSLRFSPAVAAAVKENHVNPKRIQRQVRRELQDTGMGTKSQQALKLQQEQMKTDRRAVSREKKETEARRQFELKQQKKKESGRPD